MGDRKRIAVAEDDQAMADFISEIARQAGHRVVTFASGEALMRQLTRDTFDLLLLDWNMPGTTGLDVITWIRMNMASPPAEIMISSRADKIDVAACLSAGADD